MTSSRSFWTEVWYLLLFIAVGFVLVMAISFIAMAFGYGNDVVSLHIIQWGQNLLVFILPVLCWVRWYLKQPVCSTLGFRSAQPKHYLLAAISILLLSFPMDWFAQWAQESLPWPESLRAMAQAEQQQQEAIMKLLLSPSGFLGWTECILLISILTAIAEEVVFRGALLSCFRRAGINRHVTAIVIGLIFALIHFDLYGLLPRWLLGTLFCYLLFWSGSLWPPILAHALNNLLALIQYKNGELF